jgi:hypothetical protein
LGVKSPVGSNPTLSATQLIIETEGRIGMSVIKREFYRCDYCGKEIDTRNLEYVFIPEGWRSVIHRDSSSTWVKEFHMCDKCCTEDRYRTLLEKNYRRV